jgi:hypothetical protein
MTTIPPDTPTQPRRQAQNDKLLATFKKNGRQSYRVSFRPDGGDGKAIIALIDRDPCGIERISAVSRSAAI